MLPNLSRLSISVGVGGPGEPGEPGEAAAGKKRGRADDADAEDQKQQRTGSLTCMRTLYQIASDRDVLEEFSPFKDLPPVEDEYLDDYKIAALVAIYTKLDENISVVATPEEKASIREKVAAIIKDTASWARQTADAVWRGTAVETTPEYARELVSALKRVRFRDATTLESMKWDATWGHEIYEENSEEISKQLVRNARPFFKELIEKYNDVTPCANVKEQYLIHFRFDTDSMKAAGMFHMDDLAGRREYGHGAKGDEKHFFDAKEGLFVTFCFDADMGEFECGTEVLLGTPVLTPNAMYKLSHVGGGELTARELYQIWHYDKNVAPEPGIDAQWQKSAWQSLANILQLSAEQVISNVGLDALLASGGYELHKVRAHMLNNYAHYVFHRADSTSADSNNNDVRCFAAVGQGGARPNKRYYPTRMALEDGTKVKLFVAFN